MQSGSEDPEVASLLQKCEEYVPGKVAVTLAVVATLHICYEGPILLMRFLSFHCALDCSLGFSKCQNVLFLG